MLPFIFFNNTRLNAQVKSKTYQFVLNTLLSHKVPEIDVPAAAKDINGTIFLDAREKEEFDVSHLPNAVFVGYDDFKKENVPVIAAGKKIVVYCAVGKRSENITEKLVKMGYSNVFNLYGGIFEWVNDGHTVYDQHNQPTMNVHAYSRLWGRFLQKGNKVY